ncbi:MAG: T9SS type A sorting domain-containing protein, partial [Bacteroidales bacterium]|nr:T9SS type A sorting domain-containing protein [Bacteroidales bacterium]
KYSLQAFTLSASATSGLGITFASSDPAVAVITGSRNCNFRGVGTSVITARQAGNATYAPARYIRTLTVSKGDQTITFGEIPSPGVEYPDFELEAEASSGLPVSFSSSDPGVATVVGSVVHITGIGTTMITASQAGSELWNPAEDVQQELVVTATGIDDTFAPENIFNIYSAANRIYIQTLENEWEGKRGTITIFDITGKAVSILDNIEFSGNSRIEIPAGDLKGLYVIEIRKGTVKITKKVVVR